MQIDVFFLKVRTTVMQAVSAAWTPRRTVWRRFCAFFTRISSDDLHPGVTALTLSKDKVKKFTGHAVYHACVKKVV